MNAVEIEEAVSDLAGQPFDPGEFPYAFLTAFGNKDTTIKRLRTGNTNASDIPGGVLQRNHIHIAVCPDRARSSPTSRSRSRAISMSSFSRSGDTGREVACGMVLRPTGGSDVESWSAHDQR